jgi:hypothetical protein
MKFQTRFAFDLGRGQMSECEVQVERSATGPIQVTLCESGLRGAELVRARYDRISTQFYGKFLRGIPAKRIKWDYRAPSSPEQDYSAFEIPLIWENGRLYSSRLKS